VHLAAARLGRADPAVDCTKCGEAIISPALVEKAAGVFEQYGADAWYERPTEDFIPAGFACPTCGNTAFEREMNILDVWFDSGSSHEAVLSVWPELTWPADVYLEGSDQHRGWFQSSLMVGLGTRGRPPFQQIVTNGFLIDVDGKKMSKSVGNTILPQDVIKESGADVIRLWTASSDYQEEIRVGKEILTRVGGGVPQAAQHDALPARKPLRLRSGRRLGAGRAARGGRPLHPRALCRRRPARPHRLRGVRVRHRVQLLVQFATVDLSSFYNDISKDRLYTFAARSSARRSAQTAMYLMADGLTRLMAPILSFTADELWRFLPGKREESVHVAVFPSAAELARFQDADLVNRWKQLVDVREQVLAEIEPLRKNKQIGSSLQAKVVLSADACRAGAPRTVSARAADAVHRVGRRAAPGAHRRGGQQRSAAASHDRAGRGREMRALLALRTSGLERSAVGRALQPVSGCVVAG
jgi:isoleucyl-tRNA synthetase